VCSSKMPVAECEGLIVIEMMPDLNRYQVREFNFLNVRWSRRERKREPEPFEKGVTP
jgi:hypothetical protein